MTFRIYDAKLVLIRLTGRGATKSVRKALCKIFKSVPTRLLLAFDPFQCMIAVSEAAPPKKFARRMKFI